jgi:hypothetical protein
MKGKLVGAPLAAGAAWLAHNRLHRTEPIGASTPTPRRKWSSSAGDSVVWLQLRNWRGFSEVAGN